jgi:hypothetical protein
LKGLKRQELNILFAASFPKTKSCGKRSGHQRIPAEKSPLALLIRAARERNELLQRVPLGKSEKAGFQQPSRRAASARTTGAATPALARAGDLTRAFVRLSNLPTYPLVSPVIARLK